MSGTDTLADYQSVLEDVTFSSTSSNPTDAGADPSRTVTWTVNDGVASSAAATTSVSITQTSASHPPALAPIDFNGDGISDALFRSNATLTEWLMNGPAITSSASPTYQGSSITPDSSWSVAGIADFNGAGADAGVLWRQSSTGTLALWQMNGAVISSSATPTYQGQAVSPNSSWSVAGVGDFNGDGDADILWRQSTTGALADWSMNGSTITLGASPSYQGNAVTPDSTWSVAGIGDFNGDGKSDILWRQSSTGALTDWQMNGSTITSGASLTYQGKAVTPDSSWSVAGIGDFTSSSMSDIFCGGKARPALWRCG